MFPITVTRPFGAVDPGRLSRDGYVIGDPTIGWSYFGPDETVLLSDQFAATHCFRLVRDPLRAHEIGVAFEPVPKRTAREKTLAKQAARAAAGKVARKPGRTERGRR